jgi:glycogen(starch) synthase
VFSGRLEWEKGVHTLLDALPAVRRRVPGVRLVIAGRGSKVDEMRAQVRRLRLGRAVTFAGWLPEAELHALVAAADCAVVPSLYEPSGLVALEAAALGTPLAVARTGGLAEFVVDGATGWTFTPGDVRELAAAVEQALTSTDAQRRARGAKARLRAEFTWETIAAQTTEVYRRARTEHRRSPRNRDVAALPAPMAYDGNLLRAL